MEKLQHDPLTKQQVKETLYDFLYKPVAEKLRYRLDTLIVRNTLLAGYSHKSFHYKGILYSCDEARAPKRWNRLLPQLKEHMEDYLNDTRTLNEREIPYVVGYINQVLNTSNNFGDYLKLFPECLHPPLKNLIASCPCSGQKLSDARVTEIQLQNTNSINLIKQRMVTNLIL